MLSFTFVLIDAPSFAEGAELILKINGDSLEVACLFDGHCMDTPSQNVLV